jgi:hypothetical protein
LNVGFKIINHNTIISNPASIGLCNPRTNTTTKH